MLLTVGQHGRNASDSASTARCAHVGVTPAGNGAQVVDFHWNPAEPFTLMSVADDSALDKGGGTLQLWRISDLITRPEEEVLAELEPHRRGVYALTHS